MTQDNTNKPSILSRGIGLTKRAIKALQPKPTPKSLTPVEEMRKRNQAYQQRMINRGKGYTMKDIIEGKNRG